MSGGRSKSTKRKKKDIEFTAENIDNTAPAQKILDELQHKNPQAYLFYSRNIKQRHTTATALKNYHYVVPGFSLSTFDDDWDGELNIDFFEPFCYKSLTPKMISTLKHIEKADPLTSYMKTKMEWQRGCRNLRLTGAFTNMMQKYESLNEEVVQCPKHIVDMAAHLDSNPDPYFDCTYNWYYAGKGNLQLICIDWIDYLLYSEFSTVYISHFNKNEHIIDETPAATFDCGTDCYILETICSTNNIIALRTKYKIFILKTVTQNCELLIETVKCVGSELPYTSISFDDYHKNILYITTLDNKLSIVNLDRLKARSVKLKGKISMVDNWNTVLGTGRGHYTHVGKKSISIYEKRSNKPVLVWTELRNLTDEIGCNDISVAKFIGEHSLYFGTDHHLFLMDLRNMHHNDKAKVVQRWTHGMECIPAYISHTSFEMNKELLVLSSQWCEDMCVLPNSSNIIKKEIDSTGIFIPYRPPSILKTLDEARQKMLCNDLYNPIDTRLCTAITGVLIMERAEKYDILMQNALGDITCHTLFPEYMETFIDNDGPQNLHDWSTSFKLPTKTYEVSSVENIASIWQQLKRLPDNFKVEGDLNDKSLFNKSEISEAFENEEVDIELQEIWLKGQSESVVDQSSFALDLHFSEDESD